MRRFLVRFLLLAVWFNAAIGLPLHQAEHLRHDMAGLVSAIADADAPDETPDAVHAACAWCTAHAAVALPTVPTAPSAVDWAEPASVGPPPLVRIASAAPVRWPFASRAPPLV